MRISARVCVPCVLATFAAVACAASNADTGSTPDSGGGAPARDAAADAPLIIIGTGSSGASSIPGTITTSGGGTLNPSTDAGGMTSGQPTGGFSMSGGSSSGPAVDGGHTMGASDGGMEPCPVEDGGFHLPDGGAHFHHDGGFVHHDGGTHPCGSGSGSSSGAGSTSASASSSGSGSGSVPTSCTQVNGAIGCCVGNTSYRCTGGTLTPFNCETQGVGGLVCGWSTKFDNYGCVATAGTDPSGANPIACE